MSQKFKLVVVLLSLVVFLSKGMTIHAEESQKYLFIGDSRFVGMQDSCQNKEGYSDITWLCKVGMDSSWVDENWATIESTPKDTIIIYEMGINGMAFQNNLDQVQRIKDLGFTVYYVELAPVDETKPNATRTNKDIESFNKKVNDFAKEDYTVISCYEDMKNSLSSDDYDSMGIHYNSNAYKTWYDLIFSGIKTKECSGVVNSDRIAFIQSIKDVFK